MLSLTRIYTNAKKLKDSKMILKKSHNCLFPDLIIRKKHLKPCFSYYVKHVSDTQ